MCEALAVSERRACRVLGQVRRTQRYASIMSDDETVLVAHVVSLATEYGRYGYRRITALLRADGWPVNHKRVERIWRQEGLKVPTKQPKRGRLWLNDGSCIRLRPEHRNHVWAYDFVFDGTREGRPLKLLNVVDEFTRECLAIEVARKQSSRVVAFALLIGMRNGLLIPWWQDQRDERTLLQNPVLQRLRHHHSDVYDSVLVELSLVNRGRSYSEAVKRAHQQMAEIVARAIATAPDNVLSKYGAARVDLFAMLLTKHPEVAFEVLTGQLRLSDQEMELLADSPVISANINALAAVIGHGLRDPDGGEQAAVFEKSGATAKGEEMLVEMVREADFGDDVGLFSRTEELTVNGNAAEKARVVEMYVVLLRMALADSAEGMPVVRLLLSDQ